MARSINPNAIGLATHGVSNASQAPDPFRMPDYPPGVLPSGVTAAQLAMDSGWSGNNGGGQSSWSGFYAGLWAEGIGFMGYPYLAELTQRPEYRRPSEVYAEEMTRKWLKLKAIGKGDKSEKIAAIEAEFRRLHVRRVMRDTIKLDGFFGRGQIYFDTGATDDHERLKSPLIFSRRTFRPGTLRALRPIDPTWTAPGIYNALDPLAENFYRPQTWFVMGNEVHATWLSTMVSRSVPDILKPAYNFGGISLSQMMKPYVDNWLRTRQSVSDLIQAFTTWVLSTDMQAYLQGGGSLTLAERAEYFANLKNNFGLMILDKTTEDFKNVSTTLAGLDHLQAQTQEHMASVSGEPLVKLTGISPSGLNATSDNEIRVFYDAINARQVEICDPPIETILRAVQLNLFGDVDEDITHEWVPLYQLDEAGVASVRKTRADEAAVWIESGVIDPDEARAVLRQDPESPYAGLDGPAPDLPESADPEGTGLGTIKGVGGDPSESVGKAGEQSRNTGANAGDALTHDREWKEEDHPRGQPGNAGEFGPGGGGGGKELKSGPVGKKSALKDTKIENGKRIQANGAPLPSHIEKLKLPPAWKDVQYSDDPKAYLLAIGNDSKGRVQSVYSKEFSDTNAKAKFDRIEELRGKFVHISEQNRNAQASVDPKIRDSADCLDLIMKMGIRPGSETDTGAKVKAYGATTLEGHHVIKTPDGVSLRFVGKKGVKLDLPVDDKELAEMLLERAERAGADGKLFPATNDGTLLRHVHTLDGGGFKTKDFRTHFGTALAYRLVSEMPKPETETEYKKTIMAVAKEVSRKLGNTPAIALQSYINPTVFVADTWTHASDIASKLYQPDSTLGTEGLDMNEPPYAHFGSADSKPVDWRKIDDPDPDDEEIETPKDVLMMLGFDPIKEK